MEYYDQQIMINISKICSHCSKICCSTNCRGNLSGVFVGTNYKQVLTIVRAHMHSVCGRKSGRWWSISHDTCRRRGAVTHWWIALLTRTQPSFQMRVAHLLRQRINTLSPTHVYSCKLHRENVHLLHLFIMINGVCGVMPTRNWDSSIF